MSELLRLAEVMNKLRSPGGCPWDAEQTHESLIKYLLEESYEFIDAVETNDRAGLQEELGDLLLQVYFISPKKYQVVLWRKEQKKLIRHYICY